ncbi:hypothetical protein [Prosthecobacter vanneervenii]|uniref:Uncharacterized protein n=1 Tax=Prosthecobacter vanneervenii TaxID=48466 RepID=A0A7W8DMW7_9BACT|nr:hypothetical protein [Prosthecobacter vanneervenii]MBB5035717.1 hypothetical protein [Prosthecobacter vanneervenii]
MIKKIVFCMGSLLALALGGLAVWAGSRDNNQGEYFDPVSGQWDRWFVAQHFIWPVALWLLVFALFGGFRQQVRK